MNIMNAWLDKGQVVVNSEKGTVKFIDKRFHVSHDAEIVWFRFTPEYGISTVQRFPDGMEVSVDFDIDDIIYAIYH